MHTQPGRSLRHGAWPAAILAGPSSERDDPQWTLHMGETGAARSKRIYRGGESSGSGGWRRRRRRERGERSAWGTACAAFRMATEFSVPSQGRRGTAPLNQLCHFYAPRLIFALFYHSSVIDLFPSLASSVLANFEHAGRNKWFLLRTLVQRFEVEFKISLKRYSMEIDAKIRRMYDFISFLFADILETNLCKGSWSELKV